MSTELVDTEYMTKDCHLGNDQMFMCYYPGKRHHPATKSTIARWVKRVITQAYNEPIRAHMPQVRGVTNTLAFSDGMDLGSILQAGSWRTPTVFTSYYLKHVHTDSQDLF